MSGVIFSPFRWWADRIILLKPRQLFLFFWTLLIIRVALDFLIINFIAEIIFFVDFLLIIIWPGYSFVIIYKIKRERGRMDVAVTIAALCAWLVMIYSSSFCAQNKEIHYWTHALNLVCLFFIFIHFILAGLILAKAQADFEKPSIFSVFIYVLMLWGFPFFATNLHGRVRKLAQN